jgi:hypothetical protein
LTIHPVSDVRDVLKLALTDASAVAEEAEALLAEAASAAA